MCYLCVHCASAVLVIAAVDSKVIRQKEFANHNHWKSYFLGNHQKSAYKLSGVLKEGKKPRGNRDLPAKLRELRRKILEKVTFEKLCNFAPNIAMVDE